MNKWLKRSAVLSLLLVITGAIGGYAYYNYCCKLGIYDFVEERDKPFILEIFDKNWHWLVSEYSVDFSPEYMLHNRASSKQPDKIGNLTIKVLYQGQEPIGFTAYFKELFYKGKILFVAVREEFRSQGYGLKLVNYAIEDLKKQGINTITLVTRTTNIPAQTIYKKAGFVETTRDNGFVWFEYTVK